MTQLAAPIVDRTSSSPPPDYNQTGINYRAPMPWPKVLGADLRKLLIQILQRTLAPPLVPEGMLAQGGF